MKLSEIYPMIKKILYTLFVDRKVEEFSYVRDVDELTQSTGTNLITNQ